MGDSVRPCELTGGTAVAPAAMSPERPSRRDCVAFACALGSAISAKRVLPKCAADAGEEPVSDAHAEGRILRVD